MLHLVQTFHFHLHIFYSQACLFHQLVLFINFLISYHISTQKTIFSSDYFAQQLCYFILSFQSENKSCFKSLFLIVKNDWMNTVFLRTYVILNMIQSSKTWNQTQEKSFLIIKIQTVNTDWEKAASFKTSTNISMIQIRKVVFWKIWMQ